MPTHPLGELRVHHEVVYMFLGLGQLQLPGYHGNHQSRTARTLWETRGEGGRRTESASTEVELVNLWFLDRELVQMIEGSKDKYEDDRKRSEWERGED